jgi:hypothetical protein
MKLTKATLKQLILETLDEELLQEVAKGPQDLPDYAYVRVFVRGTDGASGTKMITVMLTDKYGEMLNPTDKYGIDQPVWGDVSFYEKNPTPMPCDDASIIAVTSAGDGWGPFLYDIAMEIATIRSNGLAPDRHIVSNEAEEVWEFYSEQRPDVQEFQMDDEYNTLTPEVEDNCIQHKARKSTDFDSWHTTPLSRRYTKDATTLNQIRDKLIWEL